MPEVTRLSSTLAKIIATQQKTTQAFRQVDIPWVNLGRGAEDGIEHEVLIGKRKFILIPHNSLPSFIASHVLNTQEHIVEHEDQICMYRHIISLKAGDKLLFLVKLE